MLSIVGTIADCAKEHAMPGVEAEPPSQDGESERLSKPAAQAQASETPPWLGVPALEWAHAPTPPLAGSKEVLRVAPS